MQDVVRKYVVANDLSDVEFAMAGAYTTKRLERQLHFLNDFFQVKMVILHMEKNIYRSLKTNVDITEAMESFLHQNQLIMMEQTAYLDHHHLQIDIGWRKLFKLLNVLKSRYEIITKQGNVGGLDIQDGRRAPACTGNCI